MVTVFVARAEVLTSPSTAYDAGAAKVGAALAWLGAARERAKVVTMTVVMSVRFKAILGG
jgi:hypothetical protein